MSKSSTYDAVKRISYQHVINERTSISSYVRDGGDAPLVSVVGIVRGYQVTDHDTGPALKLVGEFRAQVSGDDTTRVTSSYAFLPVLLTNKVVEAHLKSNTPVELAVMIQARAAPHGYELATDVLCLDAQENPMDRLVEAPKKAVPKPKPKAKGKAKTKAKK